MRALNALLPAIYDAATCDARWPSTLGDMAAAIGADGAILGAADKLGQPFQLMKHSDRLPAEAVRAYFADPEIMAYQSEGERFFAEKPARTLFFDHDIWPTLERERETRADLRFLEAVGLRGRAGMTLNQGRAWSDILLLQFQAGAPAAPDRLRTRLGHLAPHLAKAVEVFRTLRLLEARYRAMLGALDKLGVGVCIVDERGRTVIANAEARRIFDARDGLTLDASGRLAACDDAVAGALRRAVERCCLTARGEADVSEATLVCPRRSEKTPYLIEICPIADGAGEVSTDLRGGFVCVIDPDDARRIDSVGLSTLFRLSPAERAVCDLLLGACSTQEIAERRGVAVETARAQVKAIYAKTGVRSRAELVRRAVAALPPIL